MSVGVSLTEVYLRIIFWFRRLSPQLPYPETTKNDAHLAKNQQQRYLFDLTRLRVTSQGLDFPVVNNE